jgi:glycosyltransferase involved in cell wall biosynthesis
MTDFFLSLIYLTYRPGGFDMLCNSLMNQTYSNYELIVVDDLPNRNLTDYIEGCDIPLGYYGPSKSKCYPDTSYNQANATNTGILKSSGDITVIIEDYSWLRQKTLERWCEVFSKKGLSTVVCGIGRYMEYKPPDKIGEITVWNQPFNGDFSKCQLLGMWIPEFYEGFYYAVSMDAWKALNGMDEKLDYSCKWISQIFPHLCKARGLDIHVDKKNVIDQIDHRKWSLGNPRWWLWHPRANKYVNEVEWYTPAPNCFDLPKMLGKTWLVSFPRSGSTWMRIFFEKYTSLSSRSIYENPAKNDETPIFYDTKRACIWKSHWFHEGPSKDERCIFLVRNIFDVLASFFKYVNGVYPMTDDNIRRWTGTYFQEVEKYIAFSGDKTHVYYEDLVLDFEKHATPLIRFCGWPIDEDKIRRFREEDKRNFETYVECFDRAGEGKNITRDRRVFKRRENLSEEQTRLIQNTIENYLNQSVRREGVFNIIGRYLQ